MTRSDFINFLDKLYGSSIESVFLCGPSGAFVYKNAAALSFIGDNIRDCTVLLPVCNNGAGTYDIYTADDKCYEVAVKEVDAGVPSRLFILFDKTERLASYKRLMAIESMFFSTAQCFPGSTLLIDRDFTVVYANGDALKSQTGRLTGKGGDIRHAYNAEDIRRVSEVLKSGESQHFESSQNGLILDCYLHPILCTEYNAISKKNEPVIKYVLDMAIDITDKRLVETKLSQAKKSLEQSDKSRREFMSRFSHELRTPMNAIIGMTYVARASKDADKIQTCLQKIDESANNLLKIIGDILDISRADTGKLEIINANFLLEDVLKNVVATNTAKAREKKLAFDILVSPQLSREYKGDAARLSQAINNLVGNAVKFTHSGGEVQLSVACGRSVVGTEQIIFTVRDNGIGIAEDYQSKIFESFQQLDGGISRKHGGVGAGLSITKSIITAMEGSISLYSRPGSGTAFTFDVWLNHATDQKIFSAADLARKLSVVVIDRREHCRDYLTQVFCSMGFSCKCAETAEEALAIIEGARDTSPINLVVADYSPPQSDGIAAAEIIKRRFADEIRVLLVSSYDIPDLKLNSKKTPYDSFVSKPLLPIELILGINKCFGDNSKLAIQQKAAKAERTPTPFPNIPGVDIESGLRNAGNNPKLYKLLLMQFCGDSLARVTLAYDAGNMNALSSALKVFGEQSLNLGLKALAEYAYETERVISYNVAKDVLDKAYERISTNYRQVCNDINNANQ